MASSSKRPRSAAEWFDFALPFLLTAAGLLHPESPKVWFASLGFAFVAIAGPILTGAGVVTWLSGRFGARIQGERKKAAPMLDEALETARASWVAASLAAWPLAQWWLGHETAMVVDLESRGLTVGAVILQTVVGLIAMDAWLYWKHRLLHTKRMFVFHKKHHSFRDPTPFAGFAVGPVESLLTFWPILILCVPPATHWAPLYFGLVVAFVNLNFYLHCGVRIEWAEKLIAPTGINTSAFHNIHHSHAVVHFGEAMTVWDRICKTRLVDRAN
ncbi:sterol desaturase family protein [Plesiocystis pacifica SIR-1]|uniref:Sterol desaturase family protein n=1 Tax=Plesiocystis pacifica SIR-1 TaxID=391625 RepID=A6G6P1_9BACT|nr:sterol desaturase family protein [Plesiocystis pacifica]EDM78518.1 sterol desaturase family protein [Plesiocystis pacifica SIR-1]